MPLIMWTSQVGELFDSLGIKRRGRKNFLPGVGESLLAVHRER